MVTWDIMTRWIVVSDQPGGFSSCMQFDSEKNAQEHMHALEKQYGPCMHVECMHMFLLSANKTVHRRRKRP